MKRHLPHGQQPDVFPTQHCRLEEALELVKAMARAKGNRFQAGALNSLVRALAPEFVQRALRMLSFMRTLGLRVHRDTLVALVTACSQASLISQAHDLYWSAPGPHLESLGNSL